MLVPLVRGGLGVTRLFGTAEAAARWTLGPHFDVGLALRFGDVEVVLSAAASAWIAPFVLDLGGRISLVAARF